MWVLQCCCINVKAFPHPSPHPKPQSPPSLSLKVCVCGCYSAAVSMSRPSPTPVPTLNPSPPSLSLKVCVWVLQCCCINVKAFPHPSPHPKPQSPQSKPKGVCGCYMKAYWKSWKCCPWQQKVCLCLKMTPGFCQCVWNDPLVVFGNDPRLPGARNAVPGSQNGGYSGLCLKMTLEVCLKMTPCPTLWAVRLHLDLECFWISLAVYFNRICKLLC